jgi:hypothetical protein
MGPCFFPRVRSATRGIELGSMRVVLDISWPFRDLVLKLGAATLASALRPVGKTPDRDKKSEQKQHSWRGWRLVAADMVKNCEQHDSRETGCGRRAEPRRNVDRHWQDDPYSTRDFRETDERDESVIQTRRAIFLRHRSVLLVSKHLHAASGNEGHSQQHLYDP